MTRLWSLLGVSWALSTTLSAQDKCGPDELVPRRPLGKTSTGGTTAAQRTAMTPALAPGRHPLRFARS